MNKMFSIEILCNFSTLHTYPDIASCDFCYVSKLKLHEVSFENVEDIEINTAVKFPAISKSEFQKCFKQLRNHWNMFLLNPSVRTRYDTKSILKQDLTGLNSGFAFSKICCHIKVKEPNMLYNLPIAEGGIAGFKGISATWNVNSLIQGLKSDHHVPFQ